MGLDGTRGPSSDSGGPAASTNAGPGLGAAWRLDPESTGDFLVKIKVESRVWYRWVVVDLQPPTVSGALFTSKMSVAVADPASISSVDGTAPYVRYLVVQLNMSEAVQRFDLALALQLEGGVNLISAECLQSLEAAAEIVAAAAAVMVTTAGTAAATMEMTEAASASSLANATGVQLQQQQVEGQTTKASAPPPPLGTTAANSLNGGVLLGAADAAAAVTTGRPYVRSCVAVLYGFEDSTPVITLPAGAVADLTGNPSET
ncbi:hypothetical protein PLESTF_000117800 [Pleodorina starrii]|nr:hypothetical protein PLESTF_000117800 [Pleodorina starrii]